MTAPDLSAVEAAEVARFGLDRPEVLDLEAVRVRAEVAHNDDALDLIAEVERLRLALREEQQRSGAVHVARVEAWLRSVRARVEYLNACARSNGGLSDQQRAERERSETLVAGYGAVLDLLRGVPF